MYPTIEERFEDFTGCHPENKLELMTFGLVNTMKLLPPQAWLQGLRQRLD
ncbi:MAG: hypothetical protein AAGH78_18240 [Cyanobacteria bacterium P01_H01_bin.58]